MAVDAYANLKEGWYVPGLHPTLAWILLAFVAFPVWIPIIWMNAVMWFLPKIPGFRWLDGLWLCSDSDTVDSIVQRAFEACDEVEARLGPANPDKIPTKAYPAVSCFGVAHRSGRYFGMWYYLLKHDLVDPTKTHIYGYSMASIVVSILAAAVCEPTHEERILALKKGFKMWVSYGREFLPNTFLGLPNIMRLAGRMTDVLRDCLPDDMTKLNGRLHIVVTRVWPKGEPLWVLSEFSSRDDLLEAIRASCYWPWQMGWGPAMNLRGQWAVDGGFVLKEPIPDRASPDTSPCMVGNVSMGEGSAIWTDNQTLRLIGDNIRTGIPLFRGTDIAADIALGYEQALIQHRRHLEQLSK